MEEFSIRYSLRGENWRGLRQTSRLGRGGLSRHSRLGVEETLSIQEEKTNKIRIRPLNTPIVSSAVCGEISQKESEK